MNGHRVFASNSCSESIRLAIAYRSDNGLWKTAGWWPIAAHDEWLLSTKDGQIRSAESTFYIYASSKSHEWSGKVVKPLGAEKLKMLLADLKQDDDGDWSLNLSC